MCSSLFLIFGVTCSQWIQPSLMTLNWQQQQLNWKSLKYTTHQRIHDLSFEHICKNWKLRNSRNTTIHWSRDKNGVKKSERSREGSTHYEDIWRGAQSFSANTILTLNHGGKITSLPLHKSLPQYERKKPFLISRWAGKSCLSDGTKVTVLFFGFLRSVHCSAHHTIIRRFAQN